MDKKIGNILLISLFACVLNCNDQSIRLYLQDMEQNPIRQVEVSVPFLLQVVVENIEGVEYPDSITGFESFQVTKYGSSQSTTIINGKRIDRKIFNYVLQGDTVGSYKIGPVIIKSSKGDVRSDILHFNVGDKTIAYNLKKQAYFLQVDIDKKEVFVGQDILVKLRFYYNQDFDQLKIVEPTFDGFYTNKKFTGPIDGQEEIRGGEYRYKEWSVTIYPEEVGTKVIPAIQAIYTPSSHFQHGLGGLFDMFSLNSEKSVYSSARSIKIKPLPESGDYKGVTAIGNFTKAILSLQKEKADIGEGIIATVTVTGEGNLDMIKAPKLTLTDGLRYYESNSNVDQNTKSFEYILQADRGGDFLVPSQTFVYFDPIKQLYRTLKTEPQLLNIADNMTIKQSKSEANNVDQKVESSKSEPIKKYQFKEGQINFINESGFFTEDGETTLGSFLSWLALLFGLLTFITAFYWIYLYWTGVPLLETYWLSYVLIRIAAYRAYQKQDLQALYQLLQVICKKYNLGLYGSEIPKLFEQMNHDKQKVDHWNLFLEEMMQALFSDQSITINTKQELLKQSMMWIKELLSCARFANSIHNHIKAEKR